MTDYLGAHVSIAGGWHNAPDRGVKVGCSVIQLFTQNTNQWKGKKVSDSDAALFRQKMADSGLKEVISHNIYLINLGAAPGDVRDKSMICFQEEMERCNRLGIDKIVMHPGSHIGEGEETGIKRIVEALDLLFEAASDFKGKILLETTAGQGTNLGYRFEQLQAIISGCSHGDRLAVCFDTCHTFASGYDFRTREGYDRVLADFDRIIGIDRLQAFHINDSKSALLSRVDRHEHIGQGTLGIEPFRFILNDPRLTKVPKILETPKGDADEWDVKNLKTLRDLIEKM